MEPVLKKHSLTQSAWKTIFDGYGSCTYTPVLMRPKVATKNDVTHACFLTSTVFNKKPIKDFYINIKVNTVKQLRKPKPKGWECFWLFFNCTFDPLTGKKSTNYFTIKPGGIELGIATAELDQKFLHTEKVPVLKIGTIQDINIKKVGKSIFIGIDGETALSFTGDLIDEPGTIGLYTEDALVEVSSMSYAYLDTKGEQIMSTEKPKQTPDDEEPKPVEPKPTEPKPTPGTGTPPQAQ